MRQDTEQGEGIQTFVSDEWPRITGYSRKELLGMPFSDLLHPRYREASLKRYKRRMGGEVVSGLYEMSIIRKDGAEVPVELTSAYTTYKGQRANVAFIRDITERKWAEEEQNKFFDSSLHLLLIAGLDGYIKRINPGWTEVLGYTVEELIGTSFFELVHPDDRAATLAEMDKLSTGIVTLCFENRYRCKDGSYRLLAWAAVPHPETGLVYAIAQDITERKRAEEALSESEDKYRKLFELGSDALFLIEVETGRILDLNDTALKMYGYSREEALQMKNTDFSAEPAQTRQATVEHEQQIPVRYHKKKDGTIFPTDISVAYFTWYGKEVCIAAIRDITERKQAEERERRLQEELNHSSRLASIGELAAGVAHEINNPLTGILGFSQRLLRKSADEEVSRDLEMIHNEALRAAKVVENLLTFARRREPTKEYSDINDIVQKALELRAYELKTSNIEVVTDLAPSLPKTIADFQQIQEVFLNIILNAEQAMTEAKGGGKLIIKTQEINGYIRVSLTDDGPGIPAENLDRLFNPFFTTRGERGGTGLGLSVCHGIVTGHGGRIYARSKLGKGATFIVELPVITEEVDKSKIVEA